jgi:uncharacterized protein YqhQ
MGKKLTIGGQAVMEGVMILSPKNYAVAVRKPNNKIVTKVTKLSKKKSAIRNWPIIRGVLNLINMLIIGMKAMMWSANQSTEEKEEKLSKKEIIFTILLSLVFAIALFKGIPYSLTFFIGVQEEVSPVLFNLIDGVIRVSLFLLYIWIISFMKDVKRLFQYHGAEHMSIHCYEKNLKLTVANVKKFSPIHPRCGTAFIIIVFLVAVFAYSLIPSIVLFFSPNFMELGFWWRRLILFSIRVLVFLPLVAGISYEILKASAKFPSNPILRMFSVPGLWMQKLTTNKPTAKQIEVAIASVKKAI